MKDEISLKSIFEIIKNRIVLILCVTLLTTVGTAVVTKFYITPEYTSSLKLCVVSNAAKVVDSSSAANDRNMLLYAKDMISTCIEALNAGDAYADVTNRLREMNGAYGSVKINSSNVRITQVDNSTVLKIVVTTSNPQLAYDTCQAFEQMAIERVPSVGAVKITKLDSPVLAASPSSPSLVKNCVLGAMIGFVLCSAIVILIAMLDNTVKDPSETAKQLDILLLSEIPDCSRLPTVKNIMRIRQAAARGGRKMAADKGVKDRDLLVTSDKFPFAVKEAYNTLRTNIQYALSPVNGKIVVVTSPNPSDGKSTVAINLAITLAQNSARVLLIDADLRKPTVHRKMGLNNASGLSRFIVGFETMAEALKRNILPNLDIMTSGPIPPNPSELLGSANMQTFLERASEYYDYIIIDTPPINVVTDTAVMAKFISGVLLVARYASTTLDDLKRAQDVLELAHAKLLGLTVDGVIHKKGRKGGYYKKYYAYK